MPKTPASFQTPPCPPADIDEQEYADFANTQRQDDLEAAQWVVRQQRGLQDAERIEFEAWLEKGVCHARIYAEIMASIKEVRTLAPEITQSLHILRKTGDRTETHPVSPSPLPLQTAQRTGKIARLTRLLTRKCCTPAQYWPQAAMAVMVIMLSGAGWQGWSYWQQQPVYERSFFTQKGQQLTARLPDAEEVSSQGSTIELDTATRAEIRLFRDRREVYLQDGQAMFSVHPDAKRPFHVYAGKLKITVVGTRFSVRQTSTGMNAGQTVIAVEQGHVRVSQQDPLATPPVDLTADQMLTGSETGALGPVTRLAPDSVALWRKGRLSFDQTPLARAIAEFDRYVSTGLIVRDPAIASLPVGGSYTLQQYQQFVRNLPEVLPVRLIRHGKTTEVVAR